ncbi:MAG: helix-turn-helix domain-containing protein [Candidatus Aminicenantes bacterium]|nr:helix-turn-helix domain-containing protein [Candidatus Aminicenantes bacterium]
MPELDSSRNQKKGLAVIRHYEEVTNNVSKTCRYYGISRMAFYRWLHRYRDLGPEGLRDRSRRAKPKLQELIEEIIQEIALRSRLKRSYSPRISRPKSKPAPPSPGH